MYLEKYLRKLAKRVDTINQFIACKEINGIKLFVNEIDFSALQSLFMSYLYFYYNLYQDINTKKVSIKVLENEIYEEAYAYYKSKQQGKVEKNNNKKRTLQGVFSQDNKVKFPPQEQEVK